MAKLITNGMSSIKTANSFYTIESGNLSSDLGSGSATSTPRVIPITFASASANALGAVVALYLGSGFAASTVNDTSVDLQQVYAAVTFDSTTDKITHNSHGYNNGDRVAFTGGTLPTTSPASQMIQNKLYYIVNKGTNDYQIALTAGGTAINFTNNGSGTITEWVTIGYKQLTGNQLGNSVANVIGYAWITPFVFDTFKSGGAAPIDNTASKFRLVVQGWPTASNYPSLMTSDGTNFFYGVWTDVAASFTSGTAATGTLTMTGTYAITAAETVVVGHKTYTFRADAATVYRDGDVNMGANTTAALANLRHAINGTGTYKTNHSCPFPHRHVTATASDATTLSLSALPTVYGNNKIATTETLANGGFGAATLTGATAGDIVVVKKENNTEGLKIDKDCAFTGTLGTGCATYAPGIILCRSATPTPDEVGSLVWENTAATVTMSIATPCVVTKVGHGYVDDDPIYFTTTGALPTGLTAGTTYYVNYIDADTFNVAATADGANIDTSGSQSGVHTCRMSGSYTMTVDGTILHGAHSGLRIGTATYPITIKNKATLSFPNPTNGTACGFKYYGAAYNAGRKGSFFYYGERPTYERTTLTYDVAYGGTFTAATSDICSKSAHGMISGTPVQCSTSGTLPAGISTATTYWAGYIDSGTFYLYDTYDNAIAGTGTGRVNVTDTGTGTHFIESVIVTDDTTGWAVGNSIMVGGATSKTAANTVYHTIDSISGTSIVVKPFMEVCQRKATHPVIMVDGYGVLFLGNNTVNPAQTYTSPTNLVQSGIEIDGIGGAIVASSAGAAGLPLDDAANRSKHLITHCSTHSTFSVGSGSAIIGGIEAPPEGTEISYCNTGRGSLLMTGSCYLNTSSTSRSGTVLIDNNICLAGYSSYYVSFSSSTLALFQATITNNIFENGVTNSGSFMLGLYGNGHTISGNKFWGSMGYGIVYYTTQNITGIENTFDNNTSSNLFAAGITSNISFTGNEYGQEIANTEDFNTQEGALIDYIETSCLGSPIVTITNLKETADGSTIKIRNYNNTSGDYRTWYQYGKYYSDSGDLIGETNQITDAVSTEYTFLTGAVTGVKIAAIVGCKINHAAYYGGAVHTLPTLTATYGTGTPETDVAAESTTQQTLSALLTPATDSENLVINLSQKTDATSDQEVVWSDLTIYSRKYGYLFGSIVKAISETIDYMYGEVVTPVANSLVTEANSATVGAYTGITINHSTPLMTVSSAHTQAQVVDYHYYDLTLDANMLTADWLTSVDGGLSFTSAYPITLSAAVTASAILRMGTNLLTLTSGKWSGQVVGDIAITAPGAYVLNLDANTIDFTTAGTYDLRGSTVNGTLEVTNSSGGAVTVQIESTVSITNTGPNITLDNTVSVDIVLGSLVAGSTVYFYNSTGATELFNDVVAGTSKTHTLDYGGTPQTIVIKARKAGYKTYETSASLTSAGISLSAAQEVDSTYNASYNAAMATDWSIDTGAKTVARLTTNINTIRDFHSYWNDLFSGTTYMEFDVPTSAFTKYEINFANSYVFDAATDFQKLKTGSIADPVADDLWGSIITLGGATVETVYLVQNDAEVTNYWAAGNVDILVKVKTSGALIDSGIVHIYGRDFNYIFDHTSLTITEGGKNYASLNVGADTNNTTAAATVAGYSDIVLDESGATVDITAVKIDVADTAGDYTLGVDGAGRTVLEVFEYLKYATRHNSAFTINGDAGEEHYRYSTYTEVKNSPLGTFVGGVFYGAQGVWLTNVATADALNYVLTDNAGSTHQAATPPVELSGTGIVDGSRIQVYDVTAATELANEIITGTTYALEYSGATIGNTLRIRLTYVDGVNAYKFWTTNVVAGASGASFIASQEVDAIYESNNIDGSTVTEFSVTGATIEVFIDDPDNSTSVQRLYNWFCYLLFTETGMTDQGYYIKATDTTNYTFYSGLIIKNSDGVNPLVIDGGYFVLSTGGTPVDCFDTTGGSIFMGYPHVVGLPYSSGSGLSTEEHDAVLAIQAKTANIQDNLAVATKKDVIAAS